MVGFKDGSVMVFDKDMDDQSYTIPQAREFYVNIAPKGSKNNPRAFFQVSQTSISAIEFSPDLEHVAIASLDGTLTILEYRSGTYPQLIQAT